MSLITININNINYAVIHVSNNKSNMSVSIITISKATYIHYIIIKLYIMTCTTPPLLNSNPTETHRH